MSVKARPAPPGLPAFLLPALVLYGGLVLLPVAQSVVFSFLSFGARSVTFAGTANYAELLADPVFYRAFAHNLVLALASVVIQIPLALAFALALQSSSPLSRALRSLVFSPMILPSAVVAILFTLLYNPFEGPLNAFLESAAGVSPLWLADESLVLPSLIAAISWRYIGFHMMLLLAALQAVDPSLHEAAALDGAGPWLRFRHVTLPSIFPMLRLSVLLAVLGSLKYFDIVYIMTKGGPNHASELLTTWLFKEGIEARRFGYASAVAAALMLASLAAGAAIRFSRRRRVSA